MNENNRIIQIVGFVGLIVGAACLWSATIRLPDSPAGLQGGLTPLLNVELANSKADLEKILGPAGSENRAIIAGRSSTFGKDFVLSWGIFLFVLYLLMRRIRPEFNFLGWSFVLLLCATVLLEHALVRGLADAANSGVLTDGMMSTIYWLAHVKWLLLFICTFHCHYLFYKSHVALRYAGEMLWATAVFGGASVFGISALISVVVIFMFATLCGISILFLFSPGLLCETPTSAASQTIQSQE